MRLMPVSTLRTSHKVAIDIINEKYQILLASQCQFTNIIINRLQTTNIVYVYINDQYSSDITLQTYTSQMEHIITKISPINEMYNCISEDKKNLEILLTVIHTINDIIYELSLSPNCRLTYEPNKFISESTAETNLYIAITCGLFALKLGWDTSEIINLCLAALFRDIGFIAPKTNVKGAQNLKVMHPIVGAAYLEENYELPEEVLNIIKEHHESYDGAGFPLRLKGNKICKGARVLKIVELYYDLLEKLYKAPTRIATLEADIKKRESYLDPVYLELFLKNTDVLPKDMLLELSNGDICVVVKTNKDAPFVPRVRVLESKKPDNKNKIINLANPGTPKIKSIIYNI
ncbi:hypothetical protein AN641_01900 [Candidatus Epulonipiscioides gigas]|nr:hypothetical protein AN641_01900 [Epulopiscium sp. SCG-C07WGA-EpuloA2]